jgi:hypothetical protein
MNFLLPKVKETPPGPQALKGTSDRQAPTFYEDANTTSPSPHKHPEVPFIVRQAPTIKSPLLASPDSDSSTQESPQELKIIPPLQVVKRDPKVAESTRTAEALFQARQQSTPQQFSAPPTRPAPASTSAASSQKGKSPALTQAAVSSKAPEPKAPAPVQPAQSQPLKSAKVLSLITDYPVARAVSPILESPSPASIIRDGSDAPEPVQPALSRIESAPRGFPSKMEPRQRANSSVNARPQKQVFFDMPDPAKHQRSRSDHLEAQTPPDRQPRSPTSIRANPAPSQPSRPATVRRSSPAASLRSSSSRAPAESQYDSDEDEVTRHLRLSRSIKDLRQSPVSPIQLRQELLDAEPKLGNTLSMMLQTISTLRDHVLADLSVRDYLLFPLVKRILEIMKVDIPRAFDPIKSSSAVESSTMYHSLKYIFGTMTVKELNRCLKPRKTHHCESPIFCVFRLIGTLATSEENHNTSIGEFLETVRTYTGTLNDQGKLSEVAKKAIKAIYDSDLRNALQEE